MKTSQIFRIGVLLPDLEYCYEEKIWKSLRALAGERRDVSFYFFSGSMVNAPEDFDREQNSAYDYAYPGFFDGMILLSGVFNSYLDPEAQRNFIRRWQSVPMVCIGNSGGLLPEIRIDNVSGMRALVRHMIAEHSYRKIVFIQGPLCNEDARERLEVFLSVMHEAGFETPPEYLLQGDFGERSVIEPMNRFLELGLPFDAVIAANDAMALEAGRILQSRGFKIPGPIGLAGFDDILDAPHASPSLTTINQGIEAQAAEALDLLFQLIRNGDAPARKVHSTELKVRESCGCVSSPEQRFADLELLFRKFNTLASLQSSVHRLLESAAHLEFPLSPFPSLLGTLVSYAVHPEGTPKEDVQRHLARSKCTEAELQFASEALGHLFGKLIEFEPRKLSQFLKRQLDLFSLLTEKRKSAHNQALLQAKKRNVDLSMFFDRVLASISRNSLSAVLQAELPRLGVSSFALVLDPQPLHPSGEFRIPPGGFFQMAAGSDSLGKPLPQGWIAAGTLAAPALSGDALSYMVLPVVSHHFQYGYLLAQAGPDDAVLYKTLREQLSRALEMESLFLQIIAKNRALEGQFEMARMVQTRLLPELSSRKDMAYFYEPTEAVGGDFFHLMEIRSTGETGVFISDVAGHGLSASLVTSILKTLLLQAGESLRQDPAGLLSYLNEQLLGHGIDHFVTAFYCVLSPDRHEMRFSNAGHPSPLWIDRRRVTHIEVPAKATALGILRENEWPHQPYLNHSHRFNGPGKLLLYTDGFSDAVQVAKEQNQPPVFLEQFRENLSRWAGLTPAEFTSRLTEDIARFRRNGKFEDDVCWLCLEVN